jgi:O-antigen/teichoic acid export membrane protein
VSLVSAALRLGPVVVLVLVGGLTLPGALVALAVGAYGSGAVGALLAWRVWQGPVQHGREPARELFTLARWLVLATLIGAVSNSLDTVTLAQLAGPDATGMYSSGRSLALPLLLAGGAVGAVLLPRLSRLAGSGEFGSQVRRTSLAVAGGAALLAVGSVAVGPTLVPLVYGDRYAEAVVVFQLLALSYCVQIATWPALAVLLVLDRPELIAGLSFIGLCLMGVGYVLAVPPLGAVGAAWVGLAGPVIMAGPWALLAWSSLRRARRSAGAAMTPEDALPHGGRPGPCTLS